MGDLARDSLLLRVALGTACAGPSAEQRVMPASAVAITNVNVVDVESGQVCAGQTVLITGDRIAAVERMRLRKVSQWGFVTIAVTAVRL